jgi:hypothetical protein
VCWPECASDKTSDNTSDSWPEHLSLVLIDFDILVIETYQQLVGLILVAAVVLTGFRLLWLRVRARQRFAVSGAQRRSEIRLMAADAAPQTSPLLSPTSRLRDADRREFDRLATLIDGVNARAAHVSETQSKAALKLDTVEMAVHRLLADMDGIMIVPRTAIASAQLPAAGATSRATRAA